MNVQTIQCHVCGKTFGRTKKHIQFNKRNGIRNCCSRKCSAKLSPGKPKRLTDDELKRRNKIAQKRWYTQNKQRCVERNARNREKRKKLVDTLKTACAICGETDVACLDFHHNNKDSKNICVSTMAANAYSEKRILQEIQKCIVLCSNCHRKLHARKKKG